MFVSFFKILQVLAINIVKVEKTELKNEGYFSKIEGSNIIISRLDFDNWIWFGTLSFLMMRYDDRDIMNPLEYSSGQNLGDIQLFFLNVIIGIYICN